MLRAVAAAALAVVATVGLVAVHPGSSVFAASSLGEGEEAAAAVATGDVNDVLPDPSVNAGPFAHPGGAEPGDSADAYQASADVATQNPDAGAESNSPAGGIAGGFDNIVSETKTKEATSARVETSINAEGAKQDLEDNTKALATADDKLKAATAEREKAEAMLRQADIDLDQAKTDYATAQAAASQGGLSDAAQDIAKENTATLSSEKRTYLNTRDKYSESTALVAKDQELLQKAKDASAAAMAAYTEKHEAANANRAKSEQMARAMIDHNRDTKAAAEVGEESTSDGVQRSQTMAQISAAATQQEILATDLQTEASILKQKWDNRLLEQKTAQETLDAEVARNAALAIESNKMQKNFIDASHIAAIDATAAADAKKKAALDLVQASKDFADQQTKREALKKEVERLTDIETIRKQEYAAQKAKTDSIEARSEVYSAIAEEASIATGLEQTKDEVNRDAIEYTIQKDLDNKELAAAKDKAAKDLAATNAAADAVTQDAIDKPVPEVVTSLLKGGVASEKTITQSADVMEALPETVAKAEVAATTDGGEVAATGAKTVAPKVNPGQAKKMAEDAKKAAAAARVAAKKPKTA